MIININKSYLLTALTLTLHFLTLPLLLALPWNFWISGSLIILVIGSLCWYWRYGNGQQQGSLKLMDDGTCLLASSSERDPMHFQVESAQFHAGMLRLVLRGDRWLSRSLIIARDAVTPEDYRELRTRVLQRRLPVRKPGQA